MSKHFNHRKQRKQQTYIQTDLQYNVNKDAYCTGNLHYIKFICLHSWIYFEGCGWKMREWYLRTTYGVWDMLVYRKGFKNVSSSLLLLFNFAYTHNLIISLPLLESFTCQLIYIFIHGWNSSIFVKSAHLPAKTDQEALVILEPLVPLSSFLMFSFSVSVFLSV